MGDVGDVEGASSAEPHDEDEYEEHQFVLVRQAIEVAGKATECCNRVGEAH